MSRKIIKNIFLDDLPRVIGFGKNQGKEIIDWYNSKGYTINFIFGDIKGKVTIKNYDGKFLYITYLDEEIFKINTGSFLKCSLGKLLKVKTSEFKYKKGQRIIEYNDNKTIKKDLTIVGMKKEKSFKYYKIYCNKCGFDGGYHWSIKEKCHKDEHWIYESSLLNGGCPCCSNTPKIVVENINSIYKTDPWMIPIIGEECAKTHTYNSVDKVVATCPECGKVKSKLISIDKIHNRNGISCECSDKISYPNKFSYEFLNQLDKIYKFDYLEHEYSPEWIGRKRYDNYFIYKGKEYILEMDGSFHNKDNEMSGQTKKESKAIDNYKDEIAKEHGIEVIRIDCEISNLEFIKQNILNSRLSELFDLNNIDWLKAEEFAMSNLVKIACDLWSNGINNTKEIANIMKIARSTSIDYLKRGSKYNWCDYDIEREIQKNNKLSTIRNKKHSKTINMYDLNMNLINVFPSASELDRLSEDLFDVKLNFKMISKVCLGQKNNIKVIYLNLHLKIN